MFILASQAHEALYSHLWEVATDQKYIATFEEHRKIIFEAKEFAQLTQSESYALTYMGCGDCWEQPKNGKSHKEVMEEKVIANRKFRAAFQRLVLADHVDMRSMAKDEDYKSALIQYALGDKAPLTAWLNGIRPTIGTQFAMLPKLPPDFMKKGMFMIEGLCFLMKMSNQTKSCLERLV